MALLTRGTTELKDVVSWHVVTTCGRLTSAGVARGLYIYLTLELRIVE